MWYDIMVKAALMPVCFVVAFLIVCFLLCCSFWANKDVYINSTCLWSCVSCMELTVFKLIWCKCRRVRVWRWRSVFSLRSWQIFSMSLSFYCLPQVIDVESMNVFVCLPLFAFDRCGQCDCFIFIILYYARWQHKKTWCVAHTGFVC